MKKIYSVFSAVVLLLLVACGDEVTQITNVQVGIRQVETIGDLACVEQNFGEIVYEKTSAKVYYCVDKKWTPLSKPTDGLVDTVVFVKADTVLLNSADTVVVRDSVVISNVDTLVVNEKIVINQMDTVLIRDTVVLNYQRLYDTVSTEFLNKEFLDAGVYGIFVDERDHKVYRTVTIGTQTWFAQNLNYADGGVTSYCYDNDPKNCERYGRLYTWAVAMGIDERYNSLRATTAKGKDSILVFPVQGVCPAGWHIPDSSEIGTLRDYVLAYNEVNNIEESVPASLFFKKEGSIYESSTLDFGSDRFGMSIVPSGFFGNTVIYGEMGADCFLVTSTEASDVAIRRPGFYGTRNTLDISSQPKKNARAVRCLKN